MMQYISLEDEISILPLSERILDIMDYNGIKTIGDMIRSTEEGSLVGVGCIGERRILAEIKKCVENLRTGANGYCIATDKVVQVKAEDTKTETAQDTALILELSTVYQLKPAKCCDLLKRTMRSYPDVKGETLIYRLYENEEFCSALHAKLLSILEEHEEGVSREKLDERIPRHLRNTTIAEELLISMEQHGELSTNEDVYIRIYPSIVDYVNDIENERNRHIVLDRLNGDTLQEIGDRCGITRERVRQILQKEFKAIRKNSRRFREDKYLYLFSNYDILKENFTFAFDEPCSTYEYMKLTAPEDSHPLKPLENILDDENVSASMRKQATRAIYRNFIIVNGQPVRKEMSSLIHYYVKTYCRELTPVDDFNTGYQGFLEEYDLDDFQISGGHAAESLLSRQKFVLWNQWRKFRYYDIQSRDYGNFLETLNLAQYEDLEISTLKLFRDNQELMDEYDIHDEYELHNLLKKIWDENDDTVVFKRMPTIEIGTVNRDKQVLSLLLQYSPVSAGRLGELYEEAYGVKALSVIGGYMKNFNKYLYNGMYSVDVQRLPENEFAVLSKKLTGDYYTVQNVNDIYLREFPNADISQINPYILKTLGFLVYSGYVVRNTYATAADYFRSLLTKDDVVNMNEYPKSMQHLQPYLGTLHGLLQEREIVEFDTCRYINIRKLKQCGIAKETMEDYCRAVSQFVGRGTFFTVHSLISDGFSHLLDGLGFHALLYSSVLKADRERFSYQRIGRTSLFVSGKSENIISDMLLRLISEKSKMDIYDLLDLLNNYYGIIIDKYKLVSIVRNTDMYYDVIMEAVYIDYDTYFGEV